MMSESDRDLHAHAGAIRRRDETMSDEPTPGPWTIEADAEMIHIHSPLQPTFDLPGMASPAGHHPIASMGSYNDEERALMRPQDEANARLIASAPDLLALLEDIADPMGAQAILDGGGNDTPEGQLQTIIDRARTAIAAARGTDAMECRACAVIGTNDTTKLAHAPGCKNR